MAFFFLLRALPISNIGIVDSARANDMISSFSWKVPGSIPNTVQSPGIYIAARVMAVVATNAPTSHQLTLFMVNNDPVLERIFTAHIISAKFT